MNVIDRIRDKSYLDTGCWVFGGACNKSGYGKIADEIRGRPNLVHRVAYRELVGPIPDGLCVLHSCDNPPCWNPYHLFLGTRLQNAEDRDNKGRGRSPGSPGEANGSAKISEAQVREIRALYALRDYTQSELAVLFCLSYHTISNILLRKSWKHVIEVPDARS